MQNKSGSTPGLHGLVLSRHGDHCYMLGIAGPEKADYVDNLDLFHTMEAYITWYPKKQPLELTA